MSLASLCRTHRISFESATTVKDTAGGTTREMYTAVIGLTNILCTIQNASGKEKYLFAQRNLWLDSIIYLPRNYQTSIESRFRIRELVNSRLFRILHYADEAGRDQLTKIYVQEMLK